MSAHEGTLTALPGTLVRCEACSTEVSDIIHNPPSTCPLRVVQESGGTPLVIRGGELVFCPFCSRTDFVVYHRIEAGACL